MTPSQLEKIMRPNFVFDHSEDARPMQTNEVIEGSKDFGRMMFVGLSDMYGISMQDTMAHLDMGYDSYRHKLMLFRGYVAQVISRKEKGVINEIHDNVKRFSTKIELCRNCIRLQNQKSNYLDLTKWS